MIISLIALALFVPLAVLPLVLRTRFTPAALNEMGVCLESSEPIDGSDTAQPSQGNCRNVTVVFNNTALDYCLIESV